MTGGLSSIKVGWLKNTSRAARQTALISAIFNGGLLVTLPEYPASINLEIILSTSNTCPPAPAILLREMVAVNALTGERSLPPGEAGGDVARLPGLEPGTLNDGGGDDPRREDRRPERGEAAMVLLAGTFGASALSPPVELDDRTLAASYGLFALPRDDPKAAAEDRLDTLPCFSGPLPLAPLFPPAPRGEAGPTSMGALPDRPPPPGDVPAALSGPSPRMV